MASWQPDVPERVLLGGKFSDRTAGSCIGVTETTGPVRHVFSMADALTAAQVQPPMVARLARVAGFPCAPVNGPILIDAEPLAEVRRRAAAAIPAAFEPIGQA